MKNKIKKLDKKMIVIIVGIVLLIIVLSIIVLSKDNSKSNNKDNQVNNEVLKETSYTLDEIYELISTGAYYKTELKDCDEWIEFNYVLTHFYEYFSKDKKFMIYNKVLNPLDNKLEDDIDTIMINYDEYMKITTSSESSTAYDIEVGEKWLNDEVRKTKYSQGFMINVAARSTLSSCDIINKCI